MPSLPFDESTTFTPPSAFGPYRVLHQIGSGVLGPVFRTYDPQSDRLVAVKAFRLDLLPEDVARLADGLRRLIGAAGHLAAGLEGTTAYLAMTYHAAETLDVALRHLAPAPMASALPILRGIGECIDRAWEAGPAFGHGALHPRDVFVTPGSGELSVTGFGIAPALEAIGARPPVRRPYTAPERAAGEAWDVRADVYSLGAIAHELLTGRRPAGPGEQDGTLPVSMAPELRVRIRRVLSKALAEVPAQRFGSAKELIDALMDPSSISELPLTDDAAAPAVEVAPVATPDSGEAARDAVELGASPVEQPAKPAPSVPPAGSRRQRARISTPAPLVRAGAAAEADLLVPSVDTVFGVADAPLRIDDEPARAVMPPLALPPPFPWVALAAACVACFVLGAAAMRTYDGYQFARQGGAASQTAPVVLPVKTAPAVLPTPAAGDTEVTIADTRASTKSDLSAPKAPAESTKAAVEIGRLLVRSTPTGASVAVDGKPAGRTPLTERDVSLGSHTIVVSKAGFVSETRRVTLTGRAPSSTLTVTLDAERPARSTPAAKAAATGSVTVDSRPKGAQVTIDGRASGVTPLSVPGLSPGVHAVRVELAGHKPVTTTVTVKAGETAKIAVTLEQR